MKTPFNFRQIFLFALIGISLSLASTSCKKDDPMPAPVPNIVQLAQSDTSLTILVSAVVKAGLAGTLSTTPNLTVFAPTNNAFRAAGYTQSAIDALTPAQVTSVLTPILTYHVLASIVKAANVPMSDTVKTLNGKNLYASKNANGVFMNGIKVTDADLTASNGVVHKINKMVLVPPTQTITEIVVGNPNFSLLKFAVIRANLAAALGAPGKYSVFAPLNSGFPASLDTEAEINAAPVATVAGIVTSHAFGTNIFAGDLVSGNTPATLNAASTLNVSLSPASVKITGSPNTVSNITVTDIVATNGVIHVIDKVLQ
jgi:uncharacterized surface protein with fasciclin (FAS1) repeats